MTVGPYRSIWLHAYTTQLRDVDTRAVVSASLEPSLTISTRIDGRKDDPLYLQLRLRGPDGNDVLEKSIKVDGVLPDGMLHLSVKSFTLDKGQIGLWYPRGSGAQPLYSLSLTLHSSSDDRLLDEFKTRIGFRRVELVQETLQEADQYGKGTSFFFRINNVPVFCGGMSSLRTSTPVHSFLRMTMTGSNWIPADNFLTTVSLERYHKWLELAIAGGQNMIRVWGGGVYEHEAFYDKADELGLMIWQDFMFACGVYPAHDEFVENVQGEAVEAVKRLRHHASVVVWCGNNEGRRIIDTTQYCLKLMR
jgi:beta-mannosidase